MKLNDLRKSYTDFFISNGHKLVKSSSLIPQNDPTLLFTNAGMVQFKDVFTGKEKRDYTRATTAQKCVRAGGKHNDLDNVGYTTRHHTFFEMLGNFSFGDYFKEQAIKYAWEFTTKVLGLEKDKLYITVHPSDDEARNIWRQVSGFSDSRILNIEDNIWAMGDVGPCGFDTEIFYDKGPEIAGGLPGTPDEDGDRYVEIWNNVFMQFETLPDGSKVELKNKNIDTGMGLERIASVLQGVTSNFEIDLFKNLKSYISDVMGVKITPENDTSFNVIADHIRTTAFLIAEGILPSNEGRGYVLRRIMRRALRHINMLGVKEPAFYKMFDNVRDQMGETYPELYDAESLIKQTIKTEEENFGATLDTGLKILSDELSKTSGNVLSGKSAFKLYDTYGFPVDMTADILRTKNMTVDIDEFEKLMKAQKEQSKKSSQFKGEAGNKKIFYDVREKIGATEFTGYETFENPATIKAIVKNGEIVEEISNPIETDEFYIIVDKTPFYAECGGQISDTGIIENENGIKVAVLDVIKALDNLYFHKIKFAEGSFKIGDTVNMSVDANRRKLIMANHSSAHLLQRALKEVVGEHISQKGSWVGDNGFRFDFSNPKALTADELSKIEELVNSYIERKLCVCTSEMPIEEAKKTGAIALFGEKYGDVVRVVNMGDVSIELCGGTHCSNTSDIKFFKITKEESISAGIRRIEAITNKEALSFVASKGIDTTLPPTQILKLLNEKLKQEKQEEQDKLAREFEEKKKQEELQTATDIKTITTSVKTEIVNNINFIHSVIDGVNPKNLKPAMDTLRQTNPKNTIITIIANVGEKVSIITSVSADLKDTISAVDIIRKLSAIMGGQGGGGRPDLAQSGGTDKSKSSDAINETKNIINNLKV
ncbi:alanine--tRNA ligase [bacterium]|nr:alanine--tRNA ligase [bacterium]